MGEMIMRNWDLREFHVRDNFPFLIQLVLLPIQQVKTPIPVLLIPLRQVLPLASYIRLYCPYRSHFHIRSLFLYHHHRPQSKVIPLYLYIPWPWVNTEYSMHRAQHTTTIVCLPLILMITSWPLKVPSASNVPSFKIDCHQPALHDSSQLKSPDHIPMDASQQTDW